MRIGGTTGVGVELFAFAGLFFAAVCGKPGVERQPAHAVLEAGNDAAFSERGPSLSLFTEADGYERFYAGLHANKAPAPAPPEVDFNSRAVAYISYGQKNTGGYSIDVLGVFTAGDALVIKTRLGKPPPGSFQLQVITHPYAILSFAAGDFKSVDLIDERGERLDSKPLR